VVITDRKPADPERAALVRLGHQDVVAPDGASGRWRPHRPAASVNQPEAQCGRDTNAAPRTLFLEPLLYIMYIIGAKEKGWASVLRVP
jgi:hypothetical protein